MLLWIKEKWRLILGIFLGIFSILSVILRNRDAARVLQNANESHKKENQVNDAAREKLAHRLEEVSKKTIEEIEENKKKHDDAKKDLEAKKKEFKNKVLEEDTIAKDLADHLDAELIKNDE